MACNPQVHPGFTSKFNVDVNQEIDSRVLYPAEYLSAVITSKTAECISDEPCLCGRLCALPLALCDTLCTLPVLLLDLIWSIVGAILLTIVRVFTCCMDDPVPCGDCWVAIGNNLGRLFCNICFGPSVCALTSYAACKLGNVKSFLIASIFFPCVYPVNFILSVWKLCISPKEAGDNMSKELTEVYNV